MCYIDIGDELCRIRYEWSLMTTKRGCWGLLSFLAFFEPLGSKFYLSNFIYLFIYSMSMRHTPSHAQCPSLWMTYGRNKKCTLAYWLVVQCCKQWRRLFFSSSYVYEAYFDQMSPNKDVDRNPMQMSGRWYGDVMDILSCWWLIEACSYRSITTVAS